jgi:hypothetical protein
MDNQERVFVITATTTTKAEYELGLPCCNKYVRLQELLMRAAHIRRTQDGRRAGTRQRRPSCGQDRRS